MMGPLSTVAQRPLLKTEIPGPKSRELARLLKRHEAPTVTCVTPYGPIFWERAEGIHVWDVDGNQFIDLTSAFGVASLGHSHPRVTAAIQVQSARLCHAMGDVHPAELKARLCAKLSEITFERWTKGKTSAQSFLCSSGFEAVEVAIKTARLYTCKRGIIAFGGGYHGLGYGALEATSREDFRKPFEDQLGHFVEFVPYPRQCALRSEEAESKEKEELDRLERQISRILERGGTGAILVEPFQGRGGEVIPPSGFLPMLRRVCDRFRALLIVDEIYTGFWRTGRYFGVDHSSVVPDVICLGKALTGSLPLSACVGSCEIMGAWPESTGEAIHTSTFLGNPIACAAALASIQEFDARAEDLNVFDKGRQWIGELSNAVGCYPDIREIRGVGLMIGLEFCRNARVQPSAWCDRLLQEGWIAIPSGRDGEVLALTPPLVIPAETLTWCAAELARLMLQ